MNNQWHVGQQQRFQPPHPHSYGNITPISRFSVNGRDSLSPRDALIHPNIPQQQLNPLRSNPAYIASDPRQFRVQHDTIAFVNYGHPRPQTPPRQVYSQPNLPLIAYAGTRSPKDEITPAPISKSYSEPVLKRAPSRGKLQKRNTIKSRVDRVLSRKQTPGVDWQKLPTSIFECVLEQLRLLHVGRQSRSCTTCYMRDLCNLQSICRAWELPAQRKLYSNIEILGDDDPAKLKKMKIKYGARLTLLRRTLRSRPLIASLVERLHVPDPIIPLYLANGNPNPEYDEYLCLLASLVMTCPKLEVFDGFYPFYNHTYDRLTHALSTRQNLRQHVWIIAENDDVNARAQKQLPPGLLDQHQVYQFLQYHRNWSQLQTLMLCSPGSLGVLEHEVFISLFEGLPELKNLCVSSFDADDFNNDTLMALPKLKTLRLEECPGVTDPGLAKWASSPASIFIENLSLIHQNVVSLVTLAKIFSGLIRLRRFTIVQTDASPDVPLDMAILQPLLASETVQFIHWDIGQDTSACRSSTSHQGAELKELEDLDGLHANIHLALSIKNRGFPSLTHLRAPRDTSPAGMLQSVCRPAKNGNILLAADKYSMARMNTSSKSNSLQLARIRAQDFIDRHFHKRKEWMKVVVTDHSDMEPYVPPPLSASTTRSFDSATTTSTNMTDMDDEAILEDSRTSQDWSKLMARDLPLRSSTGSDSTEKGPSGLERQITQSSDSSQSKKWNRPASTILSPIIIPSPGQTPAPRYEPFPVQEFVLPTFVGRVSIHIADNGQVFHPPKFHLLPDIPGRDSNGGVAGWGELLKVSERQKASGRPIMDDEDRWIFDGCDGTWNRSYFDWDLARRTGTKDKEQWRHMERQRAREGMRVRVQDFF